MRARQVCDQLPARTYWHHACKTGVLTPIVSLLKGGLESNSLLVLLKNSQSRRGTVSHYLVACNLEYKLSSIPGPTETKVGYAVCWPVFFSLHVPTCGCLVGADAQLPIEPHWHQMGKEDSGALTSPAMVSLIAVIGSGASVLPCTLSILGVGEGEILTSLNSHLSWSPLVSQGGWKPSALWLYEGWGIRALPASAKLEMEDEMPIWPLTPWVGESKHCHQLLQSRSKETERAAHCQAPPKTHGSGRGCFSCWFLKWIDHVLSKRFSVLVGTIFLVLWLGETGFPWNLFFLCLLVVLGKRLLQQPLWGTGYWVHTAMSFLKDQDPFLLPAFQSIPICACCLMVMIFSV